VKDLLSWSKFLRVFVSAFRQIPGYLTCKLSETASSHIPSIYQSHAQCCTSAVDTEILHILCWDLLWLQFLSCSYIFVVTYKVSICNVTSSWPKKLRDGRCCFIDPTYQRHTYSGLAGRLLYDLRARRSGTLRAPRQRRVLATTRLTTHFHFAVWARGSDTSPRAWSRTWDKNVNVTIVIKQYTVVVRIVHSSC
jgi:hypothetical protein